MMDDRPCYATATVPDLTLLFEEEDDEPIFSFFIEILSLAVSISICSCLHSLLQNGVSPLKNWLKLSINF